MVYAESVGSLSIKFLLVFIKKKGKFAEQNGSSTPALEKKHARLYILSKVMWNFIEPLYFVIAWMQKFL